MFNILITSIGTRGYLIDHFKDSLGDKFGIYACDASKYAPALQNADKAFIIPYANTKEYKKELLNICLENNVKAVLSINDLELNYLTNYKEEFKENGIEIIISDKEVIDIAFDKYLTYDFCIKNNIPVPLTFRYNEKKQIIGAIKDNQLDFPLIAKPRRGSRSVGIQMINDLEHLNYFLEIISNDNLPEEEKHIIQEYVESDKYSIHIFNNVDNKPEIVVGMVNIFRHLGETFHIKTIKDESLLKLGNKIGEELKHLGPLSVDVQKRKDGTFVVLEFNPRISGGYSLSHYAGADYPKRIVNLVDGNHFKTNGEYLDDYYMLKQFVTRGFSKEEIDSKISNLKERD